MSALNIESYVAAGFPFIGLKTLEPIRAEKIIQAELKEYNDNLDETELQDNIQIWKWDINKNFYNFNGAEVNVQENINISKAFSSFLSGKPYGVLIINNLNDSMNNQILQLFLNSTGKLKSKNLTVVLIDCSFSKLKADFLRLISFLDLSLPSAEELYQIAKSCYEAVADQEMAEEMTDEDLRWIGEQSRGLVEFEAENIYARSLSINGTIKLTEVQQQKANVIKENAALEVLKEDVSFADIGGMEAAKDFCGKTVNSPLSKGALLVGVPGGGKTLFAKALAKETNRLPVVLKFGRLFDKYVGGTEEKIDMTFKTVDSLGKIILLIDEVDKVVGGSMGGGGKTSGNEVSMRAIGTFLSWMQDREEGDAYILATCNNVIAMVESFPEFFRTGRWDIILSVGLPNVEERMAICKIKAKQYGVTEIPEEHVTENWTGSDIEQLYKTAAMLECPLMDANPMVMPLYKTAGDAIDRIQEWCKDRTIPASKPLDPSAIVARATRSIKVNTKSEKTKKKIKKKK